MKKMSCMSVLLIFLFVFLPNACAQDIAGETAQDISKVNDGKCTPLSEMSLTEQQNKAIEMIRTSYRKEILQLRSNLMVKQIEFKGLLKDPEADAEKIHATAGDIEMLRGRFDKMVLDYHLEIRNILTPLQIKSWCINEEMAVKRDGK